MECYVLKFGGTSLGSLARIEHVASIIQTRFLKNQKLVIVVSAMAGVTNDLSGLCRFFKDDAFTPEHDIVISTGELVTSGLLALALQKKGLRSRSYAGWQVPLITDSVAGSAEITDIKTQALEDCLQQGIIPVVAGFQGLSQEGRITTLGRGGSDTTAVALAAALQAVQCDIYTDVDGVYNADPNVVPSACKLNELTYEEMIELSSQGAKVLQKQSVEMAKKHQVKIQVLSSFNPSYEQGTLIVPKRSHATSDAIISITHNVEEVKVTVKGVPDNVGIAARVFGPLAIEGIHVDFVAQSYSSHGRTSLMFTVPSIQRDTTISTLQQNKAEILYEDLYLEGNVGKVSVIGAGLKSHSDTAALVFKTLGDERINIQMISTSEVRVSVIIDASAVDRALTALYRAFQPRNTNNEENILCR
jgi:aspartate kinase